jgi:lipopolysaccharide transport system permease protein
MRQADKTVSHDSTACAGVALTEAPGLSAPREEDVRGAPATLRQERDSVVQLTHVRPRRGWTAIDVPELWRHRELLSFLVWRDIKVRYKQTLLGAAWAALQPFATMVVFTVFFGRLAKMPSDGVPYPLFSFTSLLIWTYFAGALSQASQSVVNNQATVSKVYFPRLLLPTSAAVPGLLDLTIACAMLPCMMLFFGHALGWHMLAAPLFVVLAMIVALGAGLWLAAVNVRFRDVRHVVPFLVQFWLFASPVVFALSLVPEKWHWLYALNPMVGVLEGFRWAVLHTGPFPVTAFATSLAMSCVLLISGLYFFRREERVFADVS